MPTPAQPAYQLDWNLVRTFTAVAKGGSLAAGARELGLAHPTVARHIQQLEAALGVPLFDRGSQGLALNPAGAELAATAESMRASALAFESTAEGIRSDPSGRVRVAVAGLLGQIVPTLLAPSLQPRQCPATDSTAVQEPLVAVELLVGDRPLNLLEREADIAVRHVQPAQQELICRQLGGLPLGLFASAEYVARHGAPTPANLTQHWIIDGETRHAFKHGAQQQGIDIGEHQLAFRSDSVAAQISAANAGWGLIGLPLAVAKRHSALVPVLSGLPLPLIPVWLVARPELRSSPPLRRVFDALAERLDALLLPSAPSEQPALPAVGSP